MAEPSEPQGLRILVAHDLSASAEQAVQLIARAGWPASTVVRIVSSPSGIGDRRSSFANLREVRAHAQQVRSMIAFAHERASADLGRAGVTVEAGLVPGKPERAILTEAERFEADLIVVGARGQGSVAAMLLGSVSRAVVENALCSVLVARGSAARRVLLATDGSPPAQRATSIVATWPMFATAQVLLVAVGEPPPRYPRAVLRDDEWRSAFRETLATSTERACDIVDEAVEDLEAPGREVEVEVRVGDIHTEIIAAARAWSTDIVALGSNGRPLLQRLFLGSITRNVLDGVASSVLVARLPVETGPTND